MIGAIAGVGYFSRKHDHSTISKPIKTDTHTENTYDFGTFQDQFEIEEKDPTESESGKENESSDLSRKQKKNKNEDTHINEEQKLNSRIENENKSDDKSAVNPGILGKILLTWIVTVATADSVSMGVYFILDYCINK